MLHGRQAMSGCFDIYIHQDELVNDTFQDVMSMAANISSDLG